MLEFTQVSLTRRILAIIGTVSFFGTLVYMAVFKENEIALGALITGGSTILTFYFVEKVKKN